MYASMNGNFGSIDTSRLALPVSVLLYPRGRVSSYGIVTRFDRHISFLDVLQIPFDDLLLHLSATSAPLLTATSGVSETLELILHWTPLAARADYGSPSTPLLPYLHPHPPSHPSLARSLSLNSLS